MNITRYEQNDNIISIEKNLTAELFFYHKELGGEFSSVQAQLEVAEKIGEISKAIQMLRQARSHMSNVR